MIARGGPVSERGVTAHPIVIPDPVRTMTLSSSSDPASKIRDRFSTLKRPKKPPSRGCLRAREGRRRAALLPREAGQSTRSR